MDFLIQMKPIERVRAVQQITAAASDMMGWDDVDIFFGRMRLKRPTDFSNLHELIRGYLAQCSDSLLIEIADQLDLTRPNAGSDLAARLGESKYWLNDHLRVFISHVHTVKEPAGNLKLSLQKYGISAFVAHEDIEPTDEWREEILKSLMSMDAFVAVLTPDFRSSKWTDQEVGVAVARDVLIVPVSRGAVPYGFIEKYQSFNGDRRKVGHVAEGVFRSISSNARTRERMIECLAATISSSVEVDDAIFRVSKLSGIEGVSRDQWERIRENVAANAALRDADEFVESLNAVLDAHGVEKIQAGAIKQPALDDDIPF